MKGLVFRESTSTVVSHPNRMDIACFIGFVSRRMIGQGTDRRRTPIPPGIKNHLMAYGWLTPPYRRPIDDLLDVPILIDSWATFDSLYAWDERWQDATDAYPSGITYLGAAVRSFFEQGGQRCYVVRVGDPTPFNAASEARRARLPALMPGYPGLLNVSAVDQTTWSGVGHLYGLPDVTFVCLPDLPDLVAADVAELDNQYTIEIDEQFVECSTTIMDSTHDAIASKQRAPQADIESYQAWVNAVRVVALMLRNSKRDVQLVAALPLPAAGNSDDVFDLLLNDWLDASIVQPMKLGTAFLQVVYPWIRTQGSLGLPQEVENPEGTFIGVMARKAMTQGAFHSVSGEALTQVFGLYPELSNEALYRQRGIRHLASTIDRISMILPRSRGQFAIASDVTASERFGGRAANINRLMISVIRAARRIGEDVVLEPSNPDVWARLSNQMRSLLEHLEQEGALFESAASPAFSVRCDRSTMTQADIDAGRVIMQVTLQAAQPISRLQVALSVQAGGEVAIIQNDLFRRDTV